MALLLMEGFDSYKDLAEFLANPKRGPHTGFPGVISTTKVRINGQSYRGYNNGYGIGLKLDAESTATQWMNFAFNSYSPPTTTVPMFVARDSSHTAIWSLYRNSAGRVEFRRGTATVLGTTTNPYPDEVWANLSLEVYCHATAGTVELKINGVSELSLTSQDTLAGTGLCSICYIYNTGASYGYFDDIIFGDDSGTDLTSYPGDCHIEMLNPDGDGATSDWTPLAGTNWEAVDEAPATDDDTTYVYSSTAADKDLYTLGNLTTSGDAYYAVQVVVNARKEQAGFREINLTMRSNVTEVDSGAMGLGVTYAPVGWINENDPNGGGAWDETSINALQVGIELKT